MKMNDTMHISEVCKQLGTTSRTVRYYEQLGLLRTVRCEQSNVRRLDRENIERLRKILFLRKIGLSLETIQMIFRDGLDVQEFLRTRKAEFAEEISALHNRIRLLETVMHAAEHGDDIFALHPEDLMASEDAANRRIAAECTKMLLEERYADILPFVSPQVRNVLTPELISRNWREFIIPLGAFVSIGEQQAEGGTIRNFVIFENQKIVVTTPFRNRELCGLVFQYCIEKEDSHVSTNRS